MQSGTATNIASEYDAMKVSYKYLEIGADVIYGGNWSYKIIRALRDENIPIHSHVDWFQKSYWIGGFRAIGKTAILGAKKHTIELQEAGANEGARSCALQKSQQ